MTGIKKTDDGVSKYLNGLIDRSKTLSSYLNRNLFRQYQKAQLLRFQTEGASENLAWAPLQQAYQQYKRKKFASSPGGGNATMIATGRLMQGATGQDSNYFYKLVTDEKFEIGMNTSALPYSPYPGVMRPYMRFSEDTLTQWRQGIRDYITKNIQVVV